MAPIMTDNQGLAPPTPEQIRAAEQEQEPRIHEQPALVKGILKTLDTDFTLDLRQSPIPEAGTGMFAACDIPEGSTIFTANPILSCRHPSAEDICDYCFMQGNSNVHPDGRFKVDTDPLKEMKRCTGCQVARYCSTKCQSKGWKTSHKTECALLKKHGAIPATALALWRIFVMNSNNKLGAFGLTVLQQLEAHFTEHNDTDRAEDILQTVQMVTNDIPGLRDHMDRVWRMYTILLTNGGNMTPADTELAVCWSFCLPIAMLNHRCNPNAFLFMEDNKIIVRSLRKIADGDEICVSYVDENLSVLRRQEELDQKFIFNCQCKKCRRERDELATFLPEILDDEDRKKAEAKLLKVQNQLEEYVHKSFGEFHKTARPSKNMVASYVNKVQQITKAAFTDLNGEWPSTLAPLPMIRMAFCNMHRALGDLLPALRYALRGALVPRRRTGPVWVRDLSEVTNVLMLISNMPDNEDYFGNDVFPTCRQIRFVVTGYVHRLAIDAVKTFGKDVAFAKATVRMKAQLPENQGSLAEFRELFADGQGKLIHWAGDIPQRMAVVLPAKLNLDNVVD